MAYVTIGMMPTIHWSQRRLATAAPQLRFTSRAGGAALSARDFWERKLATGKSPLPADKNVDATERAVAFFS